jgi:hypothetical protein
MDEAPFDLFGGGGGFPEPQEERPRSPEVSFYCFLFYSRATALGRELAFYLQANIVELDMMFGPRLHGFAISLRDDKNDNEAVADMYRYAHAYGVGADEFPCALLSADLDPDRRVLKLPFGRFLPPTQKREPDDLGKALQIIAACASRCADASERRRVASLQRSLSRARRREYADRIYRGNRVLSRVDGDLAVLGAIADNALKVATIAAAAAALIVGGPGAATPPVSGPIATPVVSPTEP